MGIADMAPNERRYREVQQKVPKLEAEVARLRAELQDAAKAALDAVALSCEKEREADALRAGIAKALDELDDDGPKAVKYAAQELRAAIGASA